MHTIQEPTVTASFWTGELERLAIKYRQNTKKNIFFVFGKSLFQCFGAFFGNKYQRALCNEIYADASFLGLRSKVLDFFFALWRFIMPSAC